jgi:hypothetical protein
MQCATKNGVMGTQEWKNFVKRYKSAAPRGAPGRGSEGFFLGYLAPEKGKKRDANSWLLVQLYYTRAFLRPLLSLRPSDSLSAVIADCRRTVAKCPPGATAKNTSRWLCVWRGG